MIVISLRIALFIHFRSFLEVMCRQAKERKSSNIMGRTSTAGGLLEPLSMSDRPDEGFGGVS
jgi:hypothetical protein